MKNFTSRDDEFKNSLIVFLLIACVLLFAALIYVLVSDADSARATNAVNQNQIQNVDLNSNALLATVNQEAIYANEVMSVFNSYPVESRTEASLQLALDQVLNNKLLIQEAKKRGLTVSQSELDESIQSFMLTNSLTQEVLEQNLKNANFSLEEFRKSIEDTLLLQKMIEEATKNTALPTDKEIRDFFDQYSSNLTMLGKSTTRQIFLFANQTNAEAKLEQIRAVAAQLNSTNFCEKVIEYSEDETTRDNCGLYDVQQGQLLPEYEQAVYESKPGDVKLVGTRIGYHIILVQNVTQPRPANFEESKEQLNQYLLLAKKQAVLVELINELRSEAQIVDYTTKQQ